VGEVADPWRGGAVAACAAMCARLPAALAPHSLPHPPPQTPPTFHAMETTFIMIKPDGVQRGLVGQIIARFEARGYHLRAMKFQNVSKEQAEEHYADLKSKPFFGGLVDYIVR
jgi:hypothetical protein